MGELYADDPGRAAEAVAARAHLLLAMSGAAGTPLCETLENEGFVVGCVEQPAQIVARVQAEAPDLLVLDARTHRYNYLAVCDDVRGLLGDLPILVLLPTRDPVQLQRALDHKVDDCLVTPFGRNEVCVRVRVLLSRRRHQEVCTLPNLTIHPAERQVTVNGTRQHLTRIEVALISALARHVGRVLSRERLAFLVWGDEGVGDLRVVDAHISRLRRKLLRCGLAAACLQNVRGVGYLFRPDGA